MDSKKPDRPQDQANIADLGRFSGLTLPYPLPPSFRRPVRLFRGSLPISLVAGAISDYQKSPPRPEKAGFGEPREARRGEAPSGVLHCPLWGPVDNSVDKSVNNSTLRA